jgi:hypothetical protein
VSARTRLAACGLLALAVGGCNGSLLNGTLGRRSSYSGTVQVFHRFQGEPRFRYAFVPVKDQAGDLEYDTYRDLVRSQLGRRGWSEVDRSEAEVSVIFDYLLDDGKPYTVNVPLFGQTGVSGATTAGYVNSMGGYSSTTTYSPRFGVVGFASRSYATYQRRLYVMIFDSHRTVEGKPQALFQGTAISEGTTPHLSPVMPFLVDIVFSELTGVSGAISDYHSAD